MMVFFMTVFADPQNHQLMRVFEFGIGVFIDPEKSEKKIVHKLLIFLAFCNGCFVCFLFCLKGSFPLFFPKKVA